MNIQELLKIKTLEEYVADNIAIFENLYPGVLESESDYYMPVIRSTSERELRIRTEIADALSQCFWMSARDEWLDWCGEEYKVKRLFGAKPTTQIEFSIEAIMSIDITIPKGQLLLSDDNTKAYTMEDIVILAGETTASGLCELDMLIETSDIKCEIIGTLLPYTVGAKQLAPWSGGENYEDNEDYRERISMALDDNSVAGPENAYIKKTLDADSRIHQVKVFVAGDRVQIVVDCEILDDAMINRIIQACNGEDVRPLSDKIDIIKAEIVTLDITAKIYLASGISIEKLIDIKASVTTMVSGLRISQPIGLPKIIDALFIDGVEDIAITIPQVGILPTATQIIKIGNVELSI